MIYILSSLLHPFQNGWCVCVCVCVSVCVCVWGGGGGGGLHHLYLLFCKSVYFSKNLYTFSKSIHFLKIYILSQNLYTVVVFRTRLKLSRLAALDSLILSVSLVLIYLTDSLVPLVSPVSLVSLDSLVSLLTPVSLGSVDSVVSLVTLD